VGGITTVEIAYGEWIELRLGTSLIRYNSSERGGAIESLFFVFLIIFIFVPVLFIIPIFFLVLIIFS